MELFRDIVLTRARSVKDLADCYIEFVSLILDYKKAHICVLDNITYLTKGA